MAATLDALLKIEGVAAAGEFTADGKLVDFKANMDMSPKMADMSAQFCGTVTMLFNTLAGSFTQLKPLYPCQPRWGTSSRHWEGSSPTPLAGWQRGCSMA
jgi:roadblock/LC7 domain-containing protein